MLALLVSPAGVPASAAVGAQEDQLFGTAELRDASLEGTIYYLPEDTRWLPTDYSGLEVGGRIYADRIDVPARSWTTGFPGVSDRFEWFAIVYDGTFRARDDGCYRFHVRSDDGSKLFIDGDLVVGIRQGRVHLHHRRPGGDYPLPDRDSGPPFLQEPVEPEGAAGGGGEDHDLRQDEEEIGRRPAGSEKDVEAH